MQKELGPLAALEGTWTGDRGGDTSPDADRKPMDTPYRETMVFEPTGEIDNHEQVLYGLRYRTTAWRVSEDQPFHEEVGYWLWDAKEKQVLRCFIVPRGVSLVAGGTAEADATSFELEAKLGSETYGICSNLFLDREFKTVRYTFKIEIDGDTLSYEQDTQMKMKGRDDLFHHIDKNTLQKVK